MRIETEWLEIVALTPRQLKLWVEDMPALTFAFHERNKRAVWPFRKIFQNFPYEIQR